MSDDKTSREKLPKEDCFDKGPSLVRERSGADARMKREREVIDHALEVLTETPGRSEASLSDLREVIRTLLETERERADGQQSEERAATDSVLRDSRHSHRDLLRRLADELKRTRSVRDDENTARQKADALRELDRRSDSNTLSQMIIELDAIGIAANAIRSEPGSGRARVDALTYDIQASTWRVLELIGEILHAEDEGEPAAPRAAGSVSHS